MGETTTMKEGRLQMLVIVARWSEGKFIYFSLFARIVVLLLIIIVRLLAKKNTQNTFI
jgi:hypothetical protein